MSCRHGYDLFSINYLVITVAALKTFFLEPNFEPHSETSLEVIFSDEKQISRSNLIIIIISSNHNWRKTWAKN